MILTGTQITNGSTKKAEIELEGRQGQQLKVHLNPEVNDLDSYHSLFTEMVKQSERIQTHCVV